MNTCVICYILVGFNSKAGAPWGWRKCWVKIISKNFFACGAAAQTGPWCPRSWGFLDHNEARQSVGLLWTSDQLVAETSTWQHTTLTTDKHHPCSRRDSNPQFQQASGLRPPGPWGRQLQEYCNV